MSKLPANQFLPRVLSIGVLLSSSGIAYGQAAATDSGQAFPSKPIRIVAAEAGGVGDFSARVIANGLTPQINQQVIVDNRGGASGAIAAETVARSQPDGYSLLISGSNLWLLPYLRSSVPYDPIRDFSPVTLTVQAPNVLVVHAAVPVASVKELIALAKAKPGELNDAGGSAGNSNHLAAELFKSMAGVSIVRVPYKGTGPAITALAAGQVQLMFSPVPAALPHAKSGRAKILAVTSAEPSELLPGLPTIAASGLTGYEVVSILALVVPARTPAGIVNRLNQEIVRLLRTPAAKEKFLASGMEVVASSPELLGTKIKAEMTRLGKVIRDAGIRAD